MSADTQLPVLLSLVAEETIKVPEEHVAEMLFILAVADVVSK